MGKAVEIVQLYVTYWLIYKSIPFLYDAILDFRLPLASDNMAECLNLKNIGKAVGFVQLLQTIWICLGFSNETCICDRHFRVTIFHIVAQSCLYNYGKPPKQFCEFRGVLKCSKEIGRDV